MKCKTQLQVRIGKDQSDAIAGIVADARKLNQIQLSANSVATMAIGIGLPEVRRKLAGKAIK